MENAITLYNVDSTNNTEMAAYCSLPVTDKASATMLYKAMNNPDEALSNHVNETITINNIFIQPVEMTNQETGELTVNPRIVLFAEDGLTYVTVSRGIYNSLKNLCSIIGTPDSWKSPVVVKVTQRQIKERRVFGLDVVDFGDNFAE